MAGNPGIVFCLLFGICSANHRAGYFSNLACGWQSMVWTYSEQETENGSWSWRERPVQWQTHRILRIWKPNVIIHEPAFLVMSRVHETGHIFNEPDSFCLAMTHRLQRYHSLPLILDTSDIRATKGSYGHVPKCYVVSVKKRPRMGGLIARRFVMIKKYHVLFQSLRRLLSE